jgi:hypothetical protein
MKRIVAFKVEEGLAEFLDKLPNKSEFIRRAVLAQFGMNCPLCTGSGVVPRGVGEHFAAVLRANRARPCAGCGKPEDVPRAADAGAEADWPRVEQFLHGGPLYCRRCYATAPPCAACGWHIPDAGRDDHDREHHPS